jgi:hypothetical protein
MQVQVQSPVDSGRSPKAATTPAFGAVPCSPDIKHRSLPPEFVVNKPRISAEMEAALQRHYETGDDGFTREQLLKETPGLTYGILCAE